MVNNNPLEKIPLRFMFCHENKQLQECIYNQGHRCSQDFRLGGGTKSQVMTSSEIFERGTFSGTKILWMGRSEAVACVFARNQDFAIERVLKTKSAKV